MKRFFDYLKSIATIIAFIVGIIFILISKTSLFNGHPFREELCFQFGSLIFISGVTSFLMEEYSYRNVYKKAISEVIYTKEYLEKRKSIEEIWETVSKVLFKSKFEEIHTPFLQIIKEDYFPESNDVSYNSSIKQTLEITWNNDEHTEIRIKETLDMNVHVNVKDEEESKKAPSYKSNFKVLDLDSFDDNGLKNRFSYKKISVDNESIKIDSVVKKEFNEIEKYANITVDIPLSKNKNEYIISQEVERVQNIDKDDFHSYRAKFLLKDLDVVTKYPEDLDIHFFRSGTLKNFVENNIPGCKRCYYNGLILKGQGYIMTFHKKILDKKSEKVDNSEGN